MRKSFCFLVLILVLLSSCEQKDTALVPVCLSFVSEKGFDLNDSENFSYWYRAVPENSEHAYGGVTNWKEITVVDNSVNIGYFSQGKWTFYIEKRGQNGSLYKGSSDCFVVNTDLQVIDVYMNRINIENSFEELFSVTCPCSVPQSCQISCSYMKVGNDYWETFGNWARTCESGKAVFTNKKDLTEGYYIFKFSYFIDNVQTGGEVFACYLNCEKVIEGEISSKLDIKNDAILINNITTDLKIKAGLVQTFVCTGVSDFYRWYVDGVLQEGFSSSVFSLEVKDGKTYNVKCSTSSGDKTFKVVAKSATKVSWDQYVLLAKDGNYICRGFKLKGTSDSAILPKTYVATTDKESGYTLADLGLEPVVVTSYNDVLLADTIIVGKNATLLNTTTSRNWLGRHRTNDTTNTNVKTVYLAQNPTQECLRGMIGVETIYLMDGVTSIGDNSFVSLTGLKNVYITEGLQSIGMAAFDKCSALREFTIPSKVSYVGKSAFRACTNLTTIYIKSPYTNNWASDWKYDCNAVTIKK